MDRETLSAVGCRQVCKVWELGLGYEGLVIHGRLLATGDVAGQDPSCLVEDREDPVHVRLGVGEASQDEPRDKYEGQHLAESDRDGCREPVIS